MEVIDIKTIKNILFSSFSELCLIGLICIIMLDKLMKIFGLVIQTAAQHAGELNNCYHRKPSNSVE